MIQEFVKGFFSLCGYFLVGALMILAVKFLLKPPREYTRKLMHTVCFLSIFILIEAFDTWFLAAGASVLFALIVYPVLALCEKHPKFAALFNQRRKGEVKTSLLCVFIMMAVMITVFWGVLGEPWKYIIVAAVLAWGFGDAAAALVGINFGRHQIHSRLVEGPKTWEGTLAMYIISACSIFISLLFYAELSWYMCMLVALLVAVVAAFSELVSRKGRDTVNVPLATALPLFGLISLLVNWSI
ncbi:MAG: phosphatidate cytidylyltransferase [Oscillospiraceae bacterium]